MWPFTQSTEWRDRSEPGRGDRSAGPPSPPARTAPARLAVEALEDRTQPSVYTVTDLGTLGGEYSEGYGLNDRGQVAGIADTAEVTPDGFTVNRAALWDRSGGPPADLGALGGTFSVARGVNGRGQVAGVAETTDPDPFAPGTLIGHAFLWTRGAMTDLGVLPGTVNSEAWDVNDAGRAVGWSFNTYPDFINRNTSPPNNAAFVWDARSGVRELPVPPGFKNGYGGAINNGGLAVGNASDGTALHALVWHPDPHGGYTPIDLGFPTGFTRSSARGVNDAGAVVGGASRPGEAPAFLWRPDGRGGYAAVNLGTLGGTSGEALDLNNRDQVVGRSRLADGHTHAFLYDTTGLHDLNDLIPADSGWELVFARHVNDRGQVTGLGVIGGAFHGFLLTPNDLGGDHGNREGDGDGRGWGQRGALLRTVEAPGGGAVRPSEHADVRRPEDRRSAGDFPRVSGPWAGQWPDGTTFQVFADGGLGHDTLVGPPDVEQEWRIDGVNSGMLNGNIRFVEFENLVCGNCQHLFVFLPGSSVTGAIDSGAGFDALDYRPRGSHLDAGPRLPLNIELLY